MADAAILRRAMDARIFVVDDEPANVLLLKKMLSKAGFTSVVGTTDPTILPSMLDSGWPDLILLDLMMPRMDGFAVMDFLRRANTTGTYTPILVLTADVTAETREKALAGGAMDFLTKPFDRTEVLLRLGNLLHTRMLHVRLEEANETLEQRVRDRTAELLRAQIETVDKLALAAEFRDDHTGQHIRRVGAASRAIALQLGIDEVTADLIGQAAPLHDLGKIRVPDAILLKPAKLDSDEFEVIKAHTEAGWDLLRETESPVLQMAAVMAKHHHDRWDGSGYNPLVGEEIPLLARIVSVADVYDALTHERVYKPAWPVEEALATIRAGSGSQFDPLVVEAFLDIVQVLDLSRVQVL